MAETATGEERYDTVELIKEGPNLKVWRALELSLNAPCFLHRIDASGPIQPHERQLAIVALRNFSRLAAPRMPRIPDGWVGEDHVTAIEYKWDAKPLSLESNNPLACATPFMRGEIIERMIFLLAHLHTSNIVHGAMGVDCFGTDARGKLYLIDTSLDRALVYSLHDTGSSFSLATNLQSRDLARLVHGILSLLLGEELHETPHDDSWDGTDLREVEEKIRTVLKKEELVEYFLACLSAFRLGDPVYENAASAHEYWERKKLGELFR